MNVVIIEDENLTAQDLKRTLEAIGEDIRILTMLHSVEESIAFFQQPQQVDLIFSDIELGDGLSFEIFGSMDLKIPIIYSTAYNQYALEAFKTLGIDYILKPFSEESIKAALEKYRTIQNTFQTNKTEQNELLSLFRKQLRSQNEPAIILQKGDKVIPLPADQIALFYIENELVYAYTFNQEKKPISQKLNELEEIYHQNFFRANRQFLVNRKAVKDASHYFNRKMMVHLTLPFHHEIIIGKVKITNFLNWLAYT